MSSAWSVIIGCAIRNWRQTHELRADIEQTNARIKKFATEVHAASSHRNRKRKFAHLLLIGIGGSALGPQFIADALGSRKRPGRHFLLR